MFRRSGLVLQEPELLLGQATPDPEDLPGAHRERPALEHRWTARADCLGQTDPAGPGVGTLGVGTKERPFTHSLASDRRPRLVGPIRHGRPPGSTARGPVGWSISCQTGTASPTSATAFAGCCTPAPAPPAEGRTPPTADRPV